VNRVPEGFLQRSDLWSNLPSIRAPEFLGRELQVFGKAPVGADPQDPIGDAHVRVADPALVAGPTENVALGGNDVSRLDAVLACGLRADVHHLAQKLMSNHPDIAALAVERVADHVVEGSAEPDTAVGAAEPCQSWPDDRHPGIPVILTRIKARLGHLFSP